MIEVLWHGRGGQGAFTAARLLGAAASLEEGKYALAFPSFGPERRGAPMRAFTKISEQVIGDRSAIATADFVVYLDDTLLGEGFESELKPGGKVLVNSKNVFADSRIIVLDADGISSTLLGRAIPNTVFLGALAALCDSVTAKDAKEAVRQYMPEKLHAKNIAIIDAALEAIEKYEEAGRAFSDDSGCPDLSSNLSGGCEQGQRADESTVDAARVQQAFAGRTYSDLHIPTLRTEELDPQDFAHATCFEAGYLVAKNAGWRNVRPVVDLAACTGCLQCYMLCPDGAVFKAYVPAACQPPEPLDAAASCGTQSCRAGDNLRTEVRGVDAITAILGTTETLADLGGPADSEGSLSACGGVQPAGLDLQPAGQRRAPEAQNPQPVGQFAGRKKQPEVVVAFDYDFCKGCAICEKACPADAISMISEKEALAK